MVLNIFARKDMLRYVSDRSYKHTSAMKSNEQACVDMTDGN